MFGLNPTLLVAFFVGIIGASGAILFFLLRRKKTPEQKVADYAIAEEIYEKAKYLAKDIIDYVDQISKTSEPPMTHEGKKALAVTKLKLALKTFYGWEVNDVIIDLAIEAVLFGTNFLRDLLTKKTTPTE